MALVAVKILGGFEAQTGAGRALILPTKKSQALFAYLALHPDRPCSRETLTALLWGDTPDLQARQSLRQAVYHIRRALGEDRLDIVGGETVTLPAAALDVDALNFERRVRLATPEALDAALGLYRGDLLEGLAIKEAAFDEWLLVERERLRELALEALARVLGSYMKAGDNERAIQSALRLLALDPLQEAAHRALMRLYVREGRRAAALRQYQTCVGILQKELGAEPEPETQQLYQQIVPQPAMRPGAESPRPAAAAPVGTAGVISAETPLVGRQAEAARLRRALHETWQGSGSALALIGDAGVGKSRLADEIAAAAIAEGGRLLIGNCHETEHVLPVRPWINALRAGDVVATIATMPELAPVWRLELARLLPELAEPGTEPVTTSESSLRLFEAIVELRSEEHTSELQSLRHIVCRPR